MPLSNVSGSIEGSAGELALGAEHSKTVAASVGPAFVDRRQSQATQLGRPERRQFGSSHAELSAAGRELAVAIDQYKIQHHRRYLTCDEILRVLSQLGYSKAAT